MKILLKSLVLNFSLIAALSAVGINQLLKLIVYWIREKKLKLIHLTEAGGMPSAHSAMVCALSTTVGLQYGFGSPIFAVTTAFSLIVMYDAMGVRRATGKQSVILNKILQDTYKGEEISEEKLSELMGHSPIEVFFGAILGIVIALILYCIFYLPGA